MNKYLAFDLEIFKPIPEGETNWKAHRPLGISCAATLLSDEATPGLWHSADKTQPMLRRDAMSLVGYLDYMAARGYTLLTWNGLSFDFDILAEESGMLSECADLAMNHIDMMFHFYCLKGFPLGLDTCAKGCGLPGKVEGMDGAKAPALWQAGEYQTVLDYVAQDVITTLRIARTVYRQKGFDWRARSGRRNSVRINEWKTVKECLALPEPDNSWMANPMTRSSFTEWMP